MQSTDATYSPDLEKLVSYVFHELPPDEEARMNDFLDTDPHAADIVDGIIRYCHDRGIRDRAEYEQAWALEMETAKRRLAEREVPPQPPPDSKKWIWVVGFLLLLCAAGAFWYYREGQKKKEKEQEKERQEAARRDSIAALRPQAQAEEPQPPGPTTAPADPAAAAQDFVFDPAERDTLLAFFRKTEIGNRTLGGGGRAERDTTWAYWFSKQNLDIPRAMQMLRQKAADPQQNMQRAEYYVLGALCLLYDRNCPPTDAVQFLEKANGVLGRRNYKRLMLTAYLQNKQYGEAQKWAQQQAVPRSEWPKGADKWLR